jgi:hypothetical protein
MAEFSSRDIENLKPRGFRGYGPLRIPDIRDDRIRRFNAKIENPEDFSDAARLLDPEHEGMFIAFSERVASLAVRQQSSADLRDGLIANTLAYMVARDWRDVMLVLAPLFRAAELISPDPVEEFAAAAKVVGPSQGHWGTADTWLMNFARRKPENRTLAVMGYVEDRDEDGFRFRRTW